MGYFANSNIYYIIYQIYIIFKYIYINLASWFSFTAHVFFLRFFHLCKNWSTFSLGYPPAPMPPWPRSNSWAVEPLMKLKFELKELVPLAQWSWSRSWGFHGTGETYNIYIECINVGLDLGKFEVCVVSEICGPPMMKILEFQRNTKYIRNFTNTKKTWNIYMLPLPTNLLNKN